MPPNSPKFYLTTPIYYVNARPHIGHAYTTIVADVLARRHRLLGEDTFFLTGTDEHGQKIERSAAAAGMPPQQFTDKVSAEFQSLWDRMGLTYNKFIRTTDPAHKRGVQQLFRELYDRGFIYLSTYTGSYCVSDEAFVDLPAGTPCPDCGRLLETVTEENFFFKLSEFQLPLLNLIESNALRITPDTARNEVLSFLRGNTSVQRSASSTPAPALSSRPEAQSAAAETPADTPATALSSRSAPERATRVEGPAEEPASAPDQASGSAPTTAAGNPYVPGALKDLSVSRSSFTWGIPVPDDVQRASGTQQNHVIYVWLDALANYITAIGYGSDNPAEQAEFEKYWPADLHLVGKEITRFHCVYWPAFLLAAGLPTPKQITANGWLLFDNAKMSKSKGNVVRTETILDAFGTLCPPVPVNEAGTNGKGTASAVPKEQAEQAALAAEVRPATPHERDLFATDVLRYFLLREIPFGQDGSFSFDALVTRYNADLANGYGNLVKRTLTLLQQNFDAYVSEPLAHESFVIQLNQRSGLRQGELSELAGIEVNGPRLAGDATAAGIFYTEAFFALRFASPIDPDLAKTSKSGVLDAVLFLVGRTDAFITASAPWRLAKDPERRPELADVLYTAAESIRIITALLYPILPYATARVWSQLGLGDIERAARHGELNNLQWGGLQPGTQLGPLSPIFPRPQELAQIMTDMEESRTTTPQPEATLKAAATPTPAAPVTANPSDPAAPPRTSSLDEPSGALPVGGSNAEAATLPTTPGPHTEATASGPFARSAVQAGTGPEAPEEAPTHITIDDFLKVELRVAQVLVVERIPKADKLLRLEVDLGTETRQILSGIAQWYTPEELIGRRIVVVANLAPRKMRGLESHGMLLAASEGADGKPILATFGEDIALGSRVR